MSALSVVPVSSRRQKRQFLNLPWALYRDVPQWIPPLRLDQAELVGYHHHPYFARNEIQTFLALRGTQVCGRVAAIVNYDHIETHNERIGYFGFFESIDDPEVARGLVTAAGEWLAGHDLHRIRGPMNPGFNYVFGTLIDAFDRPPSFMMPYNPPYYPGLLEACGFKKAQDFFAFWGNREMLPDIHAKLHPIANRVAERFDVRIRPLDRSRFAADVADFLHIYNRAMARHWGFEPMSAAEIKKAAAGLKWLIEPRLALAAEIDGKVVGVVFAMLDYNPRIKQIDGRLLPFGLLRLLWKRRHIKSIRVLAASVLPEYQMHGLGLVLVDRLVPAVVDWGIQEAEFSWVAESNAMSRGSLEKGGAKCTKTYRVYERQN